jgi:AcrR family transcriptional regulator
MSNKPTIPELIWTRPEPGTRSPRLSREAIAQAAIAIADAEGLGAVSMRRVAAELDAGTMSLYHYVANKDELFALILDMLMGEQYVPDDELPLDDWRAALSAIARSARKVFLKHGWIHDERVQVVPHGPNGMRHFDQSLAAAAATGLPRAQQMEVIGQLDDFVMGFAMNERQLRERGGFDELADDIASVTDYMNQMIATGEYPYLAEFVGGDDFITVARRIFESMDPEERFERGLRRLLDGIGAEIERDGGGS